MSNSVTESLKQEDTKTYYTPEIEEFRVGFEFEFKTIYVNNNKLPEKYKDWSIGNLYRKFKDSKDFIDVSEFIHSDYKGIINLWGIEEDIEFGHIRVKYLDQEDIESLGFESSKYEYFSIKYDFEYYKLEDYGLLHWEDSNKVAIFKLDKDRTPDPDGKYKRKTIFEGIIKNKSELKILLKQVNAS